MNAVSISQKFLGDFFQKVGAAGHTEFIGISEQTQYRDMSAASISQKFLGDFLQKVAKQIIIQNKKEKQVSEHYGIAVRVTNTD